MKPNNVNTATYKNLKTTPHARQRAYERMGLTSETELRKRAHAARMKGISIKNLNLAICEDFGLEYEAFKRICDRYTYKYSTSKIFFYKDFFYVFGGKDSKTLITVVDFDKEGYEQKKIDILAEKTKLIKEENNGQTQRKQEQTKGEFISKLYKLTKERLTHQARVQQREEEAGKTPEEIWNEYVSTFED